MNGREILALVVPPPRRRVGFLTLLPLIVFLAAFVGGCAGLELAHRVMFARPWALGLVALTPWLWWMHVAGGAGFTRVRGATALSVRMLLAAAFILLLAEPRAVRENDALSLMYALDVSDSIGEKASDKALEYVARTVSEKPAKDRAGLIIFGREAAVELPPRVTFPFEALNSRVAKDATSVEKGLSLAAAMLPEDTLGRVLLISDGAQTEGDLASVLDDLAGRQVVVDVLPIQYEYDREVWLEKLELPRNVRAGETYEAAVILSSLQAGAGRLSLRENGQKVFEGDVTFTAGKNRFVLPLYLREPGFYEYVAKIDVPPGEDGWAENNIAIGYLYLKGEGKVLVVTDPGGDARDWKEFAQALRRVKRDVVVRSAHEFPRDAFSLLPYDCIVFVNTPADALDAVQLTAVKESVFTFGAGFLMVGGKNSFGPGGYHRTPVEETLPVTMDITQKKVLPKGALVIILHTCEFPEGNTWGKRIAKEAIRVLSAEDEVGVLAMGNSGEGWVFPLTPAAEYERLVTLINRAEIGDMPSFATTMSDGLKALKASDASAKHMIIISDGDPSPPPPELIKQFLDNQISVSTVAVFPHGGQEVAIMRTIAESTGGRYYYPQDPALLPSIFIKEAKTLRRSMIQNVDFVPQFEFPSPILKGIDATPPLHGFVLTSPKPRSAVILKGPATEDVDPVLATWRYGTGKAAAFTSDLSPNWGADWVGWEHYDAFVKQLMMDISRVEEKSDLNVRSFAEGSTGMITVEDYSPRRSFLQMEARVSGPQQRTESIVLKQVSPGRYQADFPLWGKGSYTVVVGGSGDGRNERASTGFAMPYSPEYLRFRSDPAVLKEIARRTGGRVLSGAETGEDLFVKERIPRRTTRPIADLFFILIACMIPLDVGVRRIQLDWALIRGWLWRRSRTSRDTTLSALLERKKALQMPRAETAARARPSPPPPMPHVTAAAPPIAPEKPPEKTPVEAPQEETPDSTTGRLLAAKKRWKKT